MAAINHLSPVDMDNHRPQIGDLVPRAGIYTKPGVVAEVKPDGNVVVNTDPEEIKKYHRHAVTTGLTPEDKEKFNTIMDSVMEIKNDAGGRLNLLQTTMDELKRDPNNKKVTGALHNQQAVLIRKSRELPRIYQAPEDKLDN